MYLTAALSIEVLFLTYMFRRPGRGNYILKRCVCTSFHILDFFARVSLHFARYFYYVDPDTGGSDFRRHKPSLIEHRLPLNSSGSQCGRRGSARNVERSLEDQCTIIFQIRSDEWTSETETQNLQVFSWSISVYLINHHKTFEPVPISRTWSTIDMERSGMTVPKMFKSLFALPLSSPDGQQTLYWEWGFGINLLYSFSPQTISEKFFTRACLSRATDYVTHVPLLPSADYSRS
jgi:hypothetical protein